ncbi:hypothetical protein [Mycoplasmopsis opalescens]|uniref:hypothetical protein n=1 Tax=Mycoplasmopsis opalescens TaxID=114886 RepID=UPI0004A6E4BA|nr:hypothetical protein [Mycoplasmopsis opalescens]
MKNQRYAVKNDLIYRKITRDSDWTNKQLSIALDVSISTIKRKRKRLREFQKTGTKIKISHGNFNNKLVFKHSDEKFIALSKTYFKRYWLTRMRTIIIAFFGILKKSPNSKYFKLKYLQLEIFTQNYLQFLLICV